MIDTTNEKLAIIELEDVWEPGLPMSPGTLEQDDQQQLLWGYPGALWGETGIVVSGPFRIYAAQLGGGGAIAGVAGKRRN